MWPRRAFSRIGGQANSTLLTVAFAVRLANHLGDRRRS